MTVSKMVFKKEYENFEKIFDIEKEKFDCYDIYDKHGRVRFHDKLKVLKYLSENYNEDMTIGRLAKATHLSVDFVTEVITTIAEQQKKRQKTIESFFLEG